MLGRSYNIVLLVIVLCWTSTASAFPISYSKSGSYAYAYTEEDAWYNYNDDEEWMDSDSLNAYAWAEVSCADSMAECYDGIFGTYLYAEANAAQPGTYGLEGYASAISDTGAFLEFTANFPQIRVQFDYNLMADADWEYGTRYSKAEVGSYLLDITENYKVWEINFTIVMDGTPLPEPIRYGTVDELLDLANGHYYRLYLAVWEVNAYVEGEVTAYASATIENIQVDGVPLPSTLLLLGAGLLTLAAYERRNRK